jgi:hypothetical protein
MDAVEELDTAASLTANVAERRLLERRRAALTKDD